MLYTNILEVVEEERTGYAVFIASIICHMLGEVYYKSQCRINTSVLDKINLARIMMRKNLHTNKTSEAIATDLGVSYSWFRKAFKENIGISPAQYQLQLKLSKAKELLTNTDDSISEIAYQLGFDSVSHFSLFFKTKEGVTASEFKKYARPKY
jgi:AraC-like DNA-binding protein